MLYRNGRISSRSIILILPGSLTPDLLILDHALGRMRLITKAAYEGNKWLLAVNATQE